MQSAEVEKYPFVSIVIPAKNEEKNIARCIEGIYSIDYPRSKFEVFVVDNGSTDRTVEIARQMEVKTFVLQDITIAALRNYGFSQCKGDLVGFIDADCISSAQWLKEAVKIMIKKKDVVAVGGILSLEKGRSEDWIEEYWIDYLNSKYYDDIQYTSTISSFCFIVERKAMEDVGGFNEELVTCEDSDLGYRISQSGGKIVVDKNINVIHLRNAKNASEFFIRQVWQGQSNLTNIFLHKFELKELPSIVIPIIYFVSLLLFPFTFLEMLNPFRWTIIFFLITLPVVASIKTRVGLKASRLPGYFFIWFLYFSARGLGMVMKTAKWKS